MSSVPLLSETLTFPTLSNTYQLHTSPTHVMMGGRRAVVFAIDVTAASSATTISARVEWSHDNTVWFPQAAEDVSAGTVTVTPADFVFTLADSEQFSVPLYESQGKFVRLKLKADAGTPTVAVTVWRGTDR